MGNPRMTTTTLAVLDALARDPERERYGLEIGEATGLASGTVMPILARLESADWVTSGWENADPKQLGRPRRRYYRLTGEGEKSARRALAEAAAQHARLAARIGAWAPKGATS